jgi:glycerol-3-phosphate acyltransferase PlsX
MCPVRVAVDAMGGDRAPAEIVAGALEAASDEIVPVLVGPAGLAAQGLEHRIAPELIAMDEKPAEAVRSKPGSSLVVACRLVAEGDADAVVSAGNTGAMLAAALLHLRRLPGIQRPAIAASFAALRGPSVVIDGGANVDAKPELLLQFAQMGAVFAEEILGIERPVVRLLSIGEEAEKGNDLVRQTGPLLAASGLNFAGNAESRDILLGAADVVVCDGFTGNVALKAAEGSVKVVLQTLREEIRMGLREMVGGLLIRPAVRRLRARLDPDSYGGAYLLGLRSLAVVAHGNSNRAAIANAIRYAALGVEHRVVDRVAERLNGSVVASRRSPNHPTE